MTLFKRKLLSRLYREENSGDGSTDDGIDSSSGSGAVGTGNDARLALLAQINDANEEALGEDLADINDDGTTSPFRENVAAQGEDDQQAAPEPETPPVVKHKIKVNGQELELTTEELIARAQKVESADQYLAEAARQKREATAAPVVPTSQGPTAEELQRQKDAEDREIIRGIQMGSEEEALAALRRLEERASKRPSIEMDDVSNAIDERLAFNEAMREFNTKFADVVSDPVLKKLAAERDRELLASGDKRPYSSRYEEIGNSLRAWKESIGGKKADPAPVADLSSKVAKKAAAPAAPVGGTQKVTQRAEEDDNGEENASDVIAAIAKQRGGPQWMRAEARKEKLKWQVKSGR